MIHYIPVILLHREFSFKLSNLCPDCAEQLTGFGTFTWNWHKEEKLALKTGKVKAAKAKNIVGCKLTQEAKTMLTFFETRRLVDTLKHC